MAPVRRSVSLADTAPIWGPAEYRGMTEERRGIDVQDLRRLVCILRGQERAAFVVNLQLRSRTSLYRVYTDHMSPPCSQLAWIQPAYMRAFSF
jgi:hypothetical protein